MSTYQIQSIQISIATLETENSLMVTLLTEADQLLRRIGFDAGLATLKQAAQEALDLSLLSRGDY